MAAMDAINNLEDLAVEYVEYVVYVPRLNPRLLPGGVIYPWKTTKNNQWISP